MRLVRRRLFDPMDDMLSFETALKSFLFAEWSVDLRVGEILTSL